MIDPPLNDLLSKVDCRYSLVAIISKRARRIVDESVKDNEPLDEKAVTYAVEDLMEGRLIFKRS